MSEENSKWIEINERLVNLNSAQGSTDVEIARLDGELEKHELMLRGDPAANLEGLDEAARRMQAEINKFNRVFDKDYLGHAGLISFVTYVYEQEKARQEQSGFRWGFLSTATTTIGTIVVALLSLAGSVFLNWDKIQWRIMVRQHISQAESVERDTKKAKAAREKIKRHKAVEVPNETSPDVQE